MHYNARNYPKHSSLKHFFSHRLGGPETWTHLSWCVWLQFSWGVIKLPIGAMSSGVVWDLLPHSALWLLAEFSSGCKLQLLASHGSMPVDLHRAALSTEASFLRARGLSARWKPAIHSVPHLRGNISPHWLFSVYWKQVTRFNAYSRVTDSTKAQMLGDEVCWDHLRGSSHRH
jgi:hypothetical protein